MKEGQNQAFTELPKESLDSAAPKKDSKQIQYSSDDILDNTVAGTAEDPFVKVEAPAPDRSAEFAKKRRKATAFLKNRILAPFVGWVRGLFSPEKRIATYSVIGAIVIAIGLLTIPSFFQPRPTVINLDELDPVTGSTKREVAWSSYLNDVRRQLSDYQGSDYSGPSENATRYLSELLSNHVDVAEQLDLRIIQAEFYENFGMDQQVYDTLVAASVDYPQPPDNDPDIIAYFNRFLSYYRKMRDVCDRLKFYADAEIAQQEIDRLNSELSRITGLRTTSDNTNTSAEDGE